VDASPVLVQVEGPHSNQVASELEGQVYCSLTIGIEQEALGLGVRPLPMLHIRKIGMKLIQVLGPDLGSPVVLEHQGLMVVLGIDDQRTVR
jgi:hypothetical protein